MSAREDRAKALALASGGPDWKDMRPVERDVFRRQAASEMSHEVGDAAAEVEGQAKDRLEDLELLVGTAEGKGEGWADPDKLKALGVEECHATEDDGLAAEEARERLREYPLSVERTVAFEVVLGTGGPDDRLVFECVDASGNGPEGPQHYEIRRVLYRYSWTGSAEVELTGEDRATAERFGAEVVPELAEAL